ncbi:MAG: carbohydrate ABC transporter permease [Anaerolineales bacterium]|jgi:putative aldouronate transport system permease protein|nr:carbohydrate ABC transporter permease [Anaerolineales bacterium]
MLRSKTRDAILFQIGLAVFLTIILLLILLPFWRVIVTAFIPLDIYTREGIPFFLSPTEWTFEAFNQLLGHSMFPRAALNSIIITLLGTAISLVLTVPLAYGLSTRNLPGRKLLMTLVLFVYLFSPGLIPIYLLITGMNLTNNYLAIILPPAVSVYNTLVMMSFFEGLPEDLKDAARIDGANELQVLWHVILPLSKPILLTIGLFYAVYFWNEFFTPLLYLNDNDLMPLPVLLRNILISASFNEYVEYNAFSSSSIESLKAAGVLITMIPMLLVYPWIQRYFTKGTLVGGVKG